MNNNIPLSAKQFAEQWDVPTEPEALLNGNAQLPDINKRQGRLVGMAIDAAFIVHVYEQIKGKTSLDGLLRFFPKGISASERRVLTKPSNKDESINEEKLKLLVTMSKSSRLSSHEFLVPKSTWDSYSKNFNDYVTALKELDIYEGSSSSIIKPEDPRIQAANQDIASTLQLLNPGSKEANSILGKLSRKNVEISKIRDLNRLAILPTKPEYAEDFIKVMQMLNPSKNLPPKEEKPGNIISRFCAEPWEVFENGYFNKKVFLALDRSIENHKRTPGAEATIAEIKIIPAAMVNAEKLSALIKPLLEQLEHPSEFIAQDKKNTFGVLEQRRNQLQIKYNNKEHVFDQLVKKCREKGNFSFDYKFPDFPNEKLLNNRDTYDKLHKRLMNLAKQIHIDAIMSENPEWQRLYLKTAITQIVAKEDAKFGKSVAGKVVPHEIILDRKWLKEIADANLTTLKIVEQAIRKEQAAEQQQSKIIGR